MKIMGRIIGLFRTPRPDRPEVDVRFTSLEGRVSSVERRVDNLNKRLDVITGKTN